LLYKWGANVPEPARFDQFKLVYDYIKFHIGLYLASPAAIALMADAFGVKTHQAFRIGLSTMVIIYLVAGIHAGLFMACHVNDPWQDNYLQKIEEGIFSRRRRFMHHSLYWFGLAAGLLGLIVAASRK
jgi:hypothetical protein